MIDLSTLRHRVTVIHSAELGYSSFPPLYLTITFSLLLRVFHGANTDHIQRQGIIIS